MMKTNIFLTLSFKFWYDFRMEYQIFQLCINTIEVWLYIYYRFQILFVQNFVIFGFTTSNTNNAFAHCQ